METYQLIITPMLWAWGLFCLVMYIDTFVRYINAFINDDKTFRANIILQKVNEDFLEVPVGCFFDLITVLFVCTWLLVTLYLMAAFIAVPITIAVSAVLYARDKKRKEKENEQDCC